MKRSGSRDTLAGTQRMLEMHILAETVKNYRGKTKKDLPDCVDVELEPECVKQLEWVMRKLAAPLKGLNKWQRRSAVVCWLVKIDLMKKGYWKA